MYASGSTIYAATFGGLSISTDGGSTFVNKTTSDGLGNNAVYSVFVSDSTVYAGTLGGLSIFSPATFTSINLVGDEQRLEANIINGATLKARYDSAYKDPAPVISLSRDGGASWVTATLTNPAAEGELWLADVTWTGMDTLTAGTLTGTTVSNRKLALIITPAYDQVISSFDFYVGTASSSGTITGVLRNVSGGVPTTAIATSSVVRNCGSDVTSSRSYQNFPITPVTLMAGTSYALCVEGTSGVSLTTETVSGPAAWAVSAAQDPGSGWLTSVSRYAAKVYSAGTDLRARVVSSAGAEYRLLGFGVDFVLAGPATLTGAAGYETRTISATEATTGTLTFNGLSYTPGQRQLYAKASGHIFMAPEDFAELSPTQIQFTPGFFTPGQVVTFFVGYGLVDGSSLSLSKLNTLEEIIVGTGAQVSAGLATHSSIQTAINSAVPGQRIAVLRGTFTESLTIDREVHIYGRGRGTQIVGTITVSSSGGGASIKNCRISGNTTINSLAKNVVVSDNWIAPTYTVSGGANAFILNLGEVV